MRGAPLAAALVGVFVAACVDGTTPNCSTPDSGCYPTDAAAQPDSNDDAAPTTDAASDANGDAGPAVDATTD
jgi:hypothetical protein